MGDDFRRELGRTFDDIAGSPRPGLAGRVRASLVQAPEQRGPFWIAGLAAATLAVIVIGVIFVTNPLHRTPGTAGQGPAATPTSTAAPSSSPLPSASPTPSPLCQSAGPPATSVAGQTPPPVSYIDALRTGTHTGYDRLTVEFKNGQPGSFVIGTQVGTTFTMGASGQTVTLKGTNGILVTMRAADLHTSYSGPTDIKTGYSALVEVRQVQDFEGVVQLGLGVSGPACYTATILTNPDRLVIDVQVP